MIFSNDIYNADCCKLDQKDVQCIYFPGVNRFYRNVY